MKKGTTIQPKQSAVSRLVDPVEAVDDGEFRTSGGIHDDPWRLMVVGVAGVGKTTLARDAPGAVMIDANRGSRGIEVARATWPDPAFPGGAREFPTSWLEVGRAVEQLTTKRHQHRVLFVDTMTDVEHLLHDHVRGGKSMGEACGGFQNAYAVAMNWWRELAAAFERLQDKRGMHVVLLVHADIRKKRLPGVPEWDSYEGKLWKGSTGDAWTFWKGWCSDVLFATHDDKAVVDDSGRRYTGVSTDSRWLYTTHTATMDCKNRHGLPPRLPLRWADLAEAMASQSPARLEQLQAALREGEQWLDKHAPDRVEAFRDAVREASGNPKQLAEIHEYLNSLRAEAE